VASSAAPRTARAWGWGSVPGSVAGIAVIVDIVAAMPRGRLITIEGLDGAGKTTSAAGLASWLQSRGVTARLLREPGGVEVSERIRALVTDPGLAVTPRAEALLYAAARAQLVEELVSPLLAEGTWVVLDRFVDSSLAYQGGGRGLGVEAIRDVNRFATGGLEPDRTVLLRVDPRSEEHTSELQSLAYLVCRLLLEKKKSN